ncbi:MAG: cation:dicarboxylate symporter family transporter, partial [Sphingomonadales bacterium]
LKMVVVPLIVAAIISGVASLGDVRKLGRPGTITFIYYISTTILAVTVGMVLAEFILPGNNYNLSLNSSIINDPSSSKGLSDVLLSFISPNIIASAANLEVLPLIVFSIIFGSA